ncbi:Glycosidase, partial [human gut metagenome]
MIDDNYRNYYQVFVYSFCDSNGDGIGDLAGVTSRLDYIQDMGFNGIWLSPIMPSDSYHKYSVKDYYAIDEQYGTMQDFEKLAAECEK